MKKMSKGVVARGTVILGALTIGQAAFAGNLSASISTSLSRNVDFTKGGHESNGLRTVQFHGVRTGGTDTLVPSLFDFYCVELSESIGTGGNSWANVLPLLGSTNSGGVLFDAARTRNLQRLWDNAFPLIGSSTKKSAAFQLAQWEITFDTDLTLDDHGSFYVKNDQFQNGITDVAEGWLSKIKHNEWTTEKPLVLLTGHGIQDQVTPVPEPATLGVIALGLTTLVGRRRRRR